MTKEAPRYQGRAYAFFNCNASKEQIEAELPKIRHVTQTPSNLELTLTEGICKFIGTSILGREALAGKPIDTQIRKTMRTTP